MSWAPGDDALCIKRGPWGCAWGVSDEHGPEFGSVNRVTSTMRFFGEVYLEIKGFEDVYLSTRFIKASGYQHTEDDLAVIDLYKRTPEPADLQQVGGSPCSASEPQPVTSRGAPITENGASP